MTKEMTIAGPGETLALLGAALDKGIDPDALGKLVDLQERMVSQQAAQAWAAAMADFQAECPTISTNATGHQRNKYATLDHIMTEIREPLARHGLSVRFDSSPVEGMLRTTCWVSHSGGHREPTRFDMPVGAASRGMNDQQAYGSALSYGKRYALCAALGLTTGEPDDDGHAAGADSPPADDADIQGVEDRILKLGELRGKEVDRYALLAAVKLDSLDNASKAQIDRLNWLLEKRIKEASDA